MSVAGTVINAALSVVGMVFPAAAPAIAIAQRLEPYAEAALPLIKSALTEGPAAFAALKTAAPDFFKHLEDFSSALKGAPADQQELAVLASHIVGIDPPGWTHEETVRWWDKATGAS